VRVIALPVKSLSTSKSRLDPLLTPLERGALTLAMLEDVMDATLALTGWDTWVVSPDEAVLEVAVRRGVHVIVEEKPPLANAVRQVEAEATAHMAEVLAILLADTPFVTARALTRALRTLGPVVHAPSADESGTNLLVRRPPTAIHARFGTDSFRKHLQVAAEADLPAAVIETPELAFDLDLPGDILTVLEGDTRGRTLDVCLDMDLRSRLTARTM
jgi:2-phospho-L-lactate guanylyltransferase